MSCLDIYCDTKGHTHPVSDVEETLFICEVKQKEETHRIPKKCGCQTPKPVIMQEKTNQQSTQKWNQLQIKTQSKTAEDSFRSVSASRSTLCTSPVLQCPTAACGSSVLYLMIHLDWLICKSKINRHQWRVTEVNCSLVTNQTFMLHFKLHWVTAVAKFEIFLLLVFQPTFDW